MKKIVFFAALLLSSGLAWGQTLFVPSGTSGIGTSSSSGIGIGTSNPNGMLELKSPNNPNTLKIGYGGDNPHHISSNVPLIFNSAYPDSDLGSFYFRKITSGFDPSSFQNLMVLTANPSTLLSVNGAITATGNVIVGTANQSMIDDPNYKLLVNGKIKTKGVKVDANGWADFVFDPNFKLRPLAEVATFIKENKHLPDVPSEKEVQKNGIDVTEMQKIQMQKIEELYLYMIEMKKENEELKKQNEELQKEVKKLKKKKR